MKREIYDTTTDLDFHKNISHQMWKSALISGISMIIVGVLAISLEVMKTKYPILIYIGFALIIFSLIFIGGVYFSEKRRISKKLYGVKVDNKGIWIYGHFWPYSNIEFVLIDEYYGAPWKVVKSKWLLIKTKKTKSVEVTPELLRNPRRLWSKIPEIEKLKNLYSLEIIKDVDGFVSALLTHGIKVYWRKYGTSEFVEVDASEDIIREKFKI